MKVVRFLAAPSTALLAALFCAPGSFAALLDPAAGPGAADALTLSGGKFLASTSGTSTITLLQNQGTYTNAVYQEASGNLDFLYQYSPTIGDLGQLSALFFPSTLPILSGAAEIQTGYLTALPGIVSGTDPFTSLGTMTPDSTNYASGTVDFSYSTAVPTGSTTVIMVIKTASKVYTAGNVGYQDGGQSASPGYQPTPEPGSVGLLLTSLFAAGLFVARRYQVV